MKILQGLVSLAMLGISAFCAFSVLFIIQPFLFVLDQNLYNQFGGKVLAKWAKIQAWWVKEVLKVELRICGDKPKADNALILANHLSGADFAALAMRFENTNQLHRLKFFAKKEFMDTPVLGWGARFLNFIPLDRELSKDKSKMIKMFDRYRRDDLPIWLVCFAEGTRATPQKIKDRNSSYTHLLPPKPGGFLMTTDNIWGMLGHVQIMTIAYKTKGPITIWELAKGNIAAIHVHLRNFSMSEIPTSIEARKNWLNTHWKEMDNLLIRFHEKGSFI